MIISNADLRMFLDSDFQLRVEKFFELEATNYNGKTLRVFAKNDNEIQGQEMPFDETGAWKQWLARGSGHSYEKWGEHQYQMRRWIEREGVFIIVHDVIMMVKILDEFDVRIFDMPIWKLDANRDAPSVRVCELEF